MFGRLSQVQGNTLSTEVGRSSLARTVKDSLGAALTVGIVHFVAGEGVEEEGREAGWENGSWGEGGGRGLGVRE